jgi:pilus assembly protein CpaC
MKALALAAALALITLPAEAACTGKADFRLHLTPGEEALLPLPATPQKVAIGDPSIAKVSDVGDKHLMLLGGKPGRSNGFLWMGQDVCGLDILVTPPLAPLQAQLKADKRFADVTIGEAGGRMVASGSVADLQTRMALEPMLQATLGPDYLDRVAVRQNLMVSVEVKFAAVSTSTLKSIGFDFATLSDNIQGAVIGPGAVSSFAFPAGRLQLSRGLPVADAFSVFFSLPGADFNSILGMLGSLRAATTLAQPTLVVRSGEEASFIAGGKIPVPVPRGDNGVGITFEDFGIRLTLRPTVLAHDRIILKIAPEISEINAADGVSVGGTSVPALNRRAASTVLELGSGQSFILAGLMSESAADTRDQVPLLGDLPVIGAFFKRVRSSKERQELIIVATPRIVSPFPDGSLPGPLPGASLRGETAAEPAHGLLP